MFFREQIHRDCLIKERFVFNEKHKDFIMLSQSFYLFNESTYNHDTIGIFERTLRENKQKLYNEIDKFIEIEEADLISSHISPFSRKITLKIQIVKK